MLLMISTCVQVHAQVRIAGRITDRVMEDPITGVQVQVWNCTDQRVETVVYSTREGRYSVLIPDTGCVELRFSIIGYKRLVVRFEPDQMPSELWDVSLVTETYQIEEIVLDVRPKVVQRGDTIRFFAESYTRGDEQVLQDLLSRLPGFQVLADGTVKVGQQEVDRILIEGDDLFDKKYRLLSNNMPAYPIDQVEVLKHYSPNKLLQGVEHSDKIALNLTLKNDYKSIWFGNLHVGGGGADRMVYELRPHIMNFGKSRNFYLMADLNSTGRWDVYSGKDAKEPQGEVMAMPSSSLHEFYTMDYSDLEDELSKSRGRWGQNLSGAWNAVINPTPSWKIKARTLFYRHVIDRRWNMEELVDLPGQHFSREESYSQRERPMNGSLEWDVSYDISPSQTLQWIASFQVAQKKFNQSYEDEIIAGKEAKSGDFRNSHQRFQYANKLSHRSVLLVDVQATHGRGPQQLRYTKDTIHVQQAAEHHLAGYQVGVHYVFRMAEGHLLEWKSRFVDHDEDFFVPRLEYGEEGVPVMSSAVVSKHLFGSKGWFNRAEYHGRGDRFTWNGAVTLRQLRRMDRIQKASIGGVEEGWQVNPELRGTWRFNPNHRIAVGYTFSSGSRQVVDMIPGYVQVGFRSASRGLRSPGLTKTSTWTMSHYLGNWLEGAFVHTMAYLMHFHQIGQSSVVLHPDFTWLESVWVRDPYLFSIQSTGDYFIERISSNLQIELSHGRSLRKGRYNSPQLHNYYSTTHGAAMRLRTGWTGLVNLHFGWKYRSSQLLTHSDANRTHAEHHIFSDLYITNPPKSWQVGLKWEWYYLEQSGFRSKSMGFLDLETRWELFSNSCYIYLVGENLLGRRTYSQFRMSESGYVSQMRRLVPRSVVLRLEYRFGA